MATAGYGMKFGKGYLGGSKESDHAEPDGDEKPMESEGGEDHHAAIHQHLKAMHAATGHGHSHIEHKGDGTHVAHHVSHEGEVSGPEEHGDCPGGMCGGM